MSNNSGISRRKFMIAGTAAIASPLILNMVDLDKDGVVSSAMAAGKKIYFITTNCVGCQVCRMMCPAKAIDFGDDRNEINQKKCLHCGTCYNNCPLSAITEF